MWEVRPISEWIAVIGKKPVKVRCVDVNKGDDESSNVRCRIVANDFNIDKCPDLSAVTPPLEYLRYLVSRCASSQLGLQKTKLMIQDVKKGIFLCACDQRRVCRLAPRERKHRLECAPNCINHCMGHEVVPSICHKLNRKSSRAWDL